MSKDHNPRRKKKLQNQLQQILAKKVVVYDKILTHNCDLLPLMNKTQKLLGDSVPHNASPSKESQTSGTANLKACEDLVFVNGRVEKLSNEYIIKR
ncbi:hypothetical protein CEXT_248331 [Caerostris extrusa]|uniref:Uncharacterized protein n=1 Tax=Caerostris extrusa TaxID=172846 RepID=A0AAV4XL73_CAEEX|nr:hypothetical protein CEXT_248331 [Caerostris extrusa]